MNTIKSLSLLLIAIFTVSGCITQRKDIQQGGPEKIIINPTARKSITISQLFNIKKIIKLNCNQNNMLGEIYNISFQKDFMVIKSDYLGLFDYNGNFIKVLGRKGKGPGEYLSIQGIEYNNHGFFLMDRTQQKVIQLDKEGTFIKDYFLELYGQAYIKWDNVNIVYAGNELNKYNKKLFIFDNNFNHISSFLTTKENERKYLNFIDKTNFFIFKDSLRFLYSFDNNIYNITKNNNEYSLTARYKIDFGKYTVPDDFFSRTFSNSYDFMMQLKPSPYAYRIMGFYENENKILFMFWYKDTPLLTVYNKKDHSSVIIDNIVDDIVFKGLNISPIDEFFSYYFKDNNVYFVVYPFQINDNLDKMKEKLPKDEWNNYEKNQMPEAFKNITDNDNPLLIEFELK